MFSGFVVPLLQEKTGMLEVPFGFATGCTLIGLFAAGSVCFIDGYNATQLKERMHRADTLAVQYENSHPPYSVFKLLNSYNYKFVLYLALVLITTSTYLPFFTNVSILLQYSYGFSLSQIALMMSVPVVPTLVMCPLLGFWSDRREQRGLFLLFSCLTACGSFLWLLMTNEDSNYFIVLVPLFMSQLSYCVFVSNMWPALTILMKTSSKSLSSEEDERSGRNSLAIGILSAATNVALAVSPVIIGYVLDSTFYPNKDVLSYITMTGPGQTKYHLIKTIDYTTAFKRILIGLLSLDGAVAIIFLVWQLMSPRDLNKI